jgi:hypothetical protein
MQRPQPPSGEVNIKATTEKKYMIERTEMVIFKLHLSQTWARLLLQ